MTDIALTIIAAVARNRVIGDGDRLPWRLSSDLQRFKALTLGKPLLMGRKTYESIGRPLPGRRTIVITRRPDWAPEGVEVAGGVGEAIALGRAAAAEMRAQEVMIAGGGEIYAAAIGLADRMYITWVDLAPEGDAFFPPVDPAVWREVSRQHCPAGARDDADSELVAYERDGSFPI